MGTISSHSKQRRIFHQWEGKQDLTDMWSDLGKRVWLGAQEVGEVFVPLEGISSHTGWFLLLLSS